MSKAIAAVLLLAAGTMDAAMSKVKVGEPAPEFAITTAEGKQVGRADLRGKRVLVFMWASW
jgi:cytochrome oxidase Cu insertion factor (SCO1/SenC/PrrC family)